MRFLRTPLALLAVVLILALAVSVSLAASAPEEIPIPSASKPMLYKEENGVEKEQYLEDAGILENFDPTIIGLEGTVSASVPGTYTFHPVILTGRESSYIFKDTSYPTGYDGSGNPAIDRTYDVRFHEPKLTQSVFKTKGEQIDVTEKIDDYSSYQNYLTYFIISGNKAHSEGSHDLTISINPDYAHYDTALFENGKKSVTLTYRIMRVSHDIPKTFDLNHAFLYFVLFILAVCVLIPLLIRKKNLKKKQIN